MRLSIFIKTNFDELLRRWDKFAETQFPAADKKNTFLFRDHASDLLMQLADDLQAGKSPKPEETSAKGAKSPFHKDDSAGHVHGVERRDSGFTPAQLIAEFRELRTSVLQLWLPQIDGMSEEVTADIVRFNQSIDKEIAASIETYGIAD